MTLQQLRYAVCIAKNKSMNKAAAELFISQPSLSVTIRDLEEEIGFPLFQRSSRGIVITAEGEDFLGYARQMIEQYRLMEEKFIEKKMQKQKFSVSMQHYTFAVQAFIKVAKELEMDDYEFSVHETKTYEVIENVKKQHSEIGVLYRNEFNREALSKIFGKMHWSLSRCSPVIFMYLWQAHIRWRERRRSHLRICAPIRIWHSGRETTIPFIWQKKYFPRMNTDRVLRRMIVQRC